MLREVGLPTFLHLSVGAILLTCMTWLQHFTSPFSFYYFSYSFYIADTKRIPAPQYPFLPLDQTQLTLFSARKVSAFFLSLVPVHSILTLHVWLSSRPLLLTDNS